MPAFISYSQKDEAVYSILCMALDAAGVDRWDPSKMSPGESLANQLQDAIGRCELCVFVATRRSIESPWCLAEVGAFWGAGKRVLIFLADPDLTDVVLPPQFKGNLRVDKADKLVTGIKETIDAYSVTVSSNYEFFKTSGIYGNDAAWGELIDNTETCFDILGVTLRGWRDMNFSREKFLQKARSGCQIRVLLMSTDNELLNSLLLANNKSINSVMDDIKYSYEYYSDLSKTHPNITVSQIKKGYPIFS
jgi:hypothetical protein